LELHGTRSVRLGSEPAVGESARHGRSLGRGPWTAGVVEGVVSEEVGGVGVAPRGGPANRPPHGQRAALMELRQEIHESAELPGGEVGEGRHRRDWHAERVRESGARKPGTDVGELRPWPVVPVVFDLVTRKAALVDCDLCTASEPGSVRHSRGHREPN